MKLLALLIVLLMTGCATPPGHPFGIAEGGMRMPDNQACAIRVTDDGDPVLVPCASGVR